MKIRLGLTGCVVILLSCTTAFSATVVPVVTIEDITTPIQEGESALFTVTVMNPDTTANVAISSILIGLQFADDLTDQLTIMQAGGAPPARVSLAGCRGVEVPGIMAGTGNFVLSPGASCSDNFVVPSQPLEDPDEGPPDSGTTTVNASAVTTEGVHSVIETADIKVEDPTPVPEPSTFAFMMLGCGLLGLARKLNLNSSGCRILKSPKTIEQR